MQFSDKVALVTGAGSGIGKATALRLAKGGARVAVLSRTTEEIEATRDEIIAAGGQIGRASCRERVCQYV